jgi:hypothetical protein
MSSWCRRLAIGLTALSSLGCAAVATAQQWYWQPQVEIGAEGDTNRNLVTTTQEKNGFEKKSDVGYTANASALFGYSTPTSDTVFKPIVAYSDYPTLNSNDYRAGLDLNSQLRTARGLAEIQGAFDHQAAYSAELANPQFNNVTPDLNTPATGRIYDSVIRTLITASPGYTFDLTQRANWAVKGTYQDVQYSGNNASNYAPYQYYWGATTFGYAFTPRTTGDFGAFASHQADRNDNGQVNAYGLSAEFDYKVSSQFTQRLLLTVERDYSSLLPPKNVMTATPGMIHSVDTGFGATYSTTWVGQIQKVQASVGRTYIPSGNGGTFSSDQLQIEYTRDLSQRMQMNAAAIFLDEKSVSSVFSAANYSYVNTTAGLKWKLTPTWYLSGGVAYLYEHFQGGFGNASNGVLYVSVGYLGLGKPTATYQQAYPYQQIY